MVEVSQVRGTEEEIAQKPLWEGKGGGTIGSLIMDSRQLPVGFQGPFMFSRPLFKVLLRP